MSMAVTFDPTAQIVTIVTGGSLDETQRLAILEILDDNEIVYAGANTLVDLRQLTTFDGIKNLLIQIELRNRCRIALVSDPCHHDALTKLINVAALTNEIGIFSTPEYANEWLAGQFSGFLR